MMAFKSWRGNMGVALPGRYATPTSLDQVVVAKTKHAALFFFKSKALHVFLTNLNCFQELLKKH
jgi:hypothetical protein